MCEKGERAERAGWRAGFWQGRDVKGLQKVCTCGRCTKKPDVAPPEEAAQWLDFMRKMRGPERKVRTVEIPTLGDVAGEGSTAAEGEGVGHGDSPEATAKSEGEPAVGNTAPAPEPSHDCPHYKRVVPWTEDECASCNPADPL